MNKRGFIEELMKQTNYEEEKCIIINDIFEEYFIIGKNNKEKKINDIIEKLRCDEKEANSIYEIASSIMANAIKNKIKHPFKSND